ncbi:MAG: sulfotransferase [Sphingobium sp.]|uniref:sulfotransferase family protein n=1 Tax=Sphingobium sp. TaxID=1912891 RepID=UPI0029B22110|nr:sulfotransferase [Sphingobium sp.]MDX3909942.1 sulfotransferase [Sphingobium sp.]
MLLASARRKTRLSNAGTDDGWRNRLDLLSESLHREASLTSLGRTIAHGQLVSALSNRLRAHALWQRHPEILNVPIPSPIIIVGQMRSGSTRMQRLLACDPRFTFTRFFESWTPLPRTRAWNLLDDRRLRAWFSLRMARFINPDFDVIHPTRTAQADEEIGLHNISLYSSAFEAQWRIPSFVAHTEAMDTRPVYREFKRLLQTLAWLRGDRPNRPQILKVPQFSQDLDAVLAAFPDARLICLHRDAKALVGSAASLVHNQMLVQSDRVDRMWIGREWLRKVALRDRRTNAARALATVPQVDVRFDHMQDDWRYEMHRVYRMLDLPLLPKVEAEMTRYLSSRNQARARRHVYDIADFGISPDDVAAAMASSKRMPQSQRGLTCDTDPAIQK